MKNLFTFLTCGVLMATIYSCEPEPLPQAESNNLPEIIDPNDIIHSDDVTGREENEQDRGDPPQEDI